MRRMKKEVITREQLLEITPKTEFEIQAERLSRTLEDVEMLLIRGRNEGREYVDFLPYFNDVNIVILGHIVKDSGYDVSLIDGEVLRIKIVNKGEF